MRPEPLEVRELEDRSHLVTGEVRAKHRTSDLEIVTPYEQRLEIRDGLVVKSQLTFGEAGNMSRNTHEHTRQEET